MEVYRTILGNVADPLWQERLGECTIDHIWLDQWNAQKSRLLAIGESGRPYALALERGTRLRDGDIIAHNQATGCVAVVRLRLSEVMIVDLSSLFRRPPTEAIATAIELGHAIGNQHWPAVVKDERLYIPLAVDKKVMLSVMRTYNFEGIAFAFRPGVEVVPYLSPSEVRTLFGGSAQSAEGKAKHPFASQAHHPNHHDEPHLTDYV